MGLFVVCEYVSYEGIGKLVKAFNHEYDANKMAEDYNTTRRPHIDPEYVVEEVDYDDYLLRD